MRNAHAAECREFVDAVRAEVGDPLRSITVYDADSYDVLYLRDDVDAVYSTADLAAVFEDLRLEGWGRERLESLFYAGDMECGIFAFEEAMMCHFVRDGFDGAFVTYDRGAGVDVESFLTTCRSYR